MGKHRRRGPRDPLLFFRILLLAENICPRNTTVGMFDMVNIFYIAGIKKEAITLK